MEKSVHTRAVQNGPITVYCDGMSERIFHAVKHLSDEMHSVVNIRRTDTIHKETAVTGRFSRVKHVAGTIN